jgi:ATP adenylyltransferase
MAAKPKDILWAPWRLEYIKKGGEKGCIFCQKLKDRDGLGNLVLYRGRKCFVMLNLYPYNNGHLMIVPFKHIGAWEKLDEVTTCEMIELSQKMMVILKRTMCPHGFNMGMNSGRVGGAGVIGHAHIHLVPRWTGDNNFMPVTGGTKVISQSLAQAYQLLKKEIIKSGLNGR